MQTTISPRPPLLSYLAGRLWKPMLGYLIYTAIAIWFEVEYFDEDLTLSSDIQAVASLFLGSLLALRLNTSYNKWWEARSLWGRLVNEERNLAAYVASLSNVPVAAKDRLKALLLEFPGVLMGHLRSVTSQRHLPSAVSRKVFAELEQWKRQDWIDGWQWSRLTLVGESLLQVCGGCERIRSSPLTRTYHWAILACAWIYLAAAPLVLHCRFWTIPVVMMIAAFFFALELIAADIDEPFGVSPEDLPLERLCQTIAITVEEILEAGADGLPG